jgi:putative acetyltransferase
MIRKHTNLDLSDIMTVWVKSSSLAHPFLDESFVAQVKNDMREKYIPGSETWVYEENGDIVGFIGMQGNEIGGLFVLPDNHSQGIGGKLVDFIGKQHRELEVEVFKENRIGRAFYDKYGFKPFSEEFHEPSNSVVLRMKFRT